jgi:hypothetical protein
MHAALLVQVRLTSCVLSDLAPFLKLSPLPGFPAPCVCAHVQYMYTYARVDTVHDILIWFSPSWCNCRTRETLQTRRLHWQLYIRHMRCHMHDVNDDATCGN